MAGSSGGGEDGRHGVRSWRGRPKRRMVGACSDGIGGEWGGGSDERRRRRLIDRSEEKKAG
jgi:hypothetical protein